MSWLFPDSPIPVIRPPMYVIRRLHPSEGVRYFGAINSGEGWSKEKDKAHQFESHGAAQRFIGLAFSRVFAENNYLFEVVPA